MNSRKRLFSSATLPPDAPNTGVTPDNRSGSPLMEEQMLDLSPDLLFSCLVSEVRCADPSAQLSSLLRSRLERIEYNVRRLVVNRLSKAEGVPIGSGCTPLFIACKRGNAEIVEYLIRVCGADFEIRGVYEVDYSIHHVTPMWCAAVAGHIKCVKVLLECGADPNAVSDSGSSIARSACFMTHLEIVELLAQHNADLCLPNYNGGTCLINSVQSVELCRFLLQSGVPCNAQDIQQKTALYYAIQEHRFETTQLLLEHGADPFIKSRYNDDALQIACLKGAVQIFGYLVEKVRYEPERVASAFELLGTTLLDEYRDTAKALYYWRIACRVRETFEIQKPVVFERKSIYDNVLEFRNFAELNEVESDVDLMRIQSLLICERVLSLSHKDVTYRLMYRGAAYIDSLQYQRCINLWRYALQLRLTQDTILFNDTYFTARALVKIFLDLHEKSRNNGSIGARRGGGNATHPVFKFGYHSDILAIVQLLVKDLKKCERVIRVRPEYDRHIDLYHGVMVLIVYLLHLAVIQVDKDESPESLEHVANAEILTEEESGQNRPATTTTSSSSFPSVKKRVPVSVSQTFSERRENLRLYASTSYSSSMSWSNTKNRKRSHFKDRETSMRRIIHKIVCADSPKTPSQGNSLLHLALSKSEHMFTQPDSNASTFFPSFRLARVLLECGADVNASNQQLRTPLHIVAAQDSPSTGDIINLLISYEADPDLPDEMGITPLKYLRSASPSPSSPSRQSWLSTRTPSLQCLAASVVAKMICVEEGKVVRGVQFESSFLDETSRLIPPHLTDVVRRHSKFRRISEN